MICPFALPNIGGVETHLEKLRIYLKKHNWQVILSTYQPLTTRVKGERYEKKENIEIYRFPWFANGLFPKLEHKYLLCLVYLFPGIFYQTMWLYFKNRKRISVIHSHGLTAALVAKMLPTRKRKIISTHAIYGLNHRRFLAKMVSNCLSGFDKILAVGQPSRTELVGCGLPVEKISVHPNWVDLDFWKPFNYTRKKMSVLFVGRKIKKKGIRTFYDLQRLLPKIIFQAVHNVTPATLRELYNFSTVLLMPIEYDEGYGAVYLEALACGCPIITARRGCLPYFLDDTVADMLDRPSVMDYKKLLEFYYEFPQLLEDKRKLCREYAEKNFSDRNAEVILNAYK